MRDELASLGLHSHMTSELSREPSSGLRRIYSWPSPSSPSFMSLTCLVPMSALGFEKSVINVGIYSMRYIPGSYRVSGMWPDKLCSSLFKVGLWWAKASKNDLCMGSRIFCWVSVICRFDPSETIRWLKTPSHWGKTGWSIFTLLCLRDSCVCEHVHRSGWGKCGESLLYRETWGLFLSKCSERPASGGHIAPGRWSSRSFDLWSLESQTVSTGKHSSLEMRIVFFPETM